MRNPKLEPWLEEGLNRIAISGLSGLKIAEIADSIKIAKSSFYNYFNTKDEYVEQLLEYWEEEGTVRIVKKFLLEEDNDNSVFNLIQGVYQHNYRNECILQQLRIAMNDFPFIEKKLEEVERIRISFIATLINKHGLSSEESMKLSKRVYAFFLGYLALTNMKKPSKEELKDIMDDFLLFFGEI